MNTKQIKEIGKDLIGIAGDYEDTESKEELKDLEQDLNNLLDELNLNLNPKIETTLKIKFEENLSDSSIKMIKDILNDSLGFKTEIKEVRQDKWQIKVIGIKKDNLNLIIREGFFKDNPSLTLESMKKQ